MCRRQHEPASKLVTHMYKNSESVANILTLAHRHLECSCLGLVLGRRWGTRGTAKDCEWQGNETYFAKVESRSRRAEDRTDDVMPGDMITVWSGRAIAHSSVLTVIQGLLKKKFAREGCL